MVAISYLAMLVTAASALVIPRDVNTILTNLKTIDTDTNGLTAAVKKWDGSFFGALPIDSSEKTLDSAIQSATKEVQTEKALSSADSQTVYAYLNGTIAVDTLAALTELNSREADAKKAGITGIVSSGLKSLKTDVDALGAALAKIISADTANATQAVITQIDGYFATAIAAFS